MTRDISRLVQQALSHQHSGRIDEALRIFAEVIRLDPKEPQANLSLGIAAYQAGNLPVAIQHLKISASKARKHPVPHQLLGLALLNSGNPEEARSALQRAVALAPRNPDFHAQLGEAYRVLRKPVMARRCYDQALSLDANNGYALLGLGQLEVSLGKIEAAEKLFLRSIATGTEQPAAFQRLAFTRTYKERPEFLDQIERCLADGTKRAIADQADLHWAAGKIHHDLGDSPLAAQHYRTARRLRYAPFDLAAHEERLEFMKAIFTERFFEERTDVADDSARPIFIFGMPRSGTTLVEQILARHSDVASGGELEFFRKLQRQLGLTGAPSAAIERRIQELDAKEYRRIARGYLRELDAVDRRSPHVTDKMPHNFEMLGIMSLVFPKASFVHCVRSPADVCVSLLSHALSPSHNYCITQEAVGGYFQAYDKLMQHWRQVLPVAMHRLSYEALVGNQEAESRKLVAHTGLDWQEACMEFYKGEAPVTTFSDVQVRRPIYRSSIGRWKRHGDLLERLFNALGPLAPDEVRAKQSSRPVSEHRNNVAGADNDVTRRSKSA